MNLPAHQPAAWEPEAEESTASGWFPGPLVRKLLLVALAAIALLTKKKWLEYCMYGVAAVGLGVGALAFLHI